MVTMMARPTTTSAAATTITKKAATWPSSAPCIREKATRVRLVAFSISSTHMKATMALRLIMKPTVPMVNKIAERTM